MIRNLQRSLGSVKRSEYGGIGQHLRKNSPKNLLGGLGRFYSAFDLQKMRNVAIIAHVDHGKTTLVDCLLKDSGYSYEGERIMDSNELEKEKGITIMSKVTGVPYKDYFINILDTPGHQDFGGEVERIMDMVDGVVLVVCSTEGPMAQTKFVLRKAIEAGVKPLVVINKVDRESSRTETVEGEVFDLFLDLDPDEKFVGDYNVFHASAKSGFAVPAGECFKNLVEPNTKCILDSVIASIPPPKINEVETDKFSMLVSQIEHNNYHGRISRGKVMSGKVKVGDRISCYDADGNLLESNVVKKIFKDVALNWVEFQEAFAGELVNIAGLEKSNIGNSICFEGDDKKLIQPTRKMEPPMIMVRLRANTSPQTGRETTINSSLSILASRLRQESELDAALECEDEGSSAVIVRGRGDLHLGILFEKLRREGYEFEVTNPQVLQKEVNGVVLEPVELVKIEVDNQYVPKIMERVMHRHGTVMEVSETLGGKQLIQLEAFSRALFGFRVEISSMTGNTAIYESTLHDWQELPDDLEPAERGSLICTEIGQTTAYGMRDLEKLGTLFVGPQTLVYEGMIIGESASENSWNVNPCKAKQLTNIRTHSKDETIRLNPPRLFNIEDAISYIRDDELIEITPKSIRMRKAILSKAERSVAERNERNLKKSTKAK